MKEPFWMINGELLKLRKKEPKIGLFRLIRIWFMTQLRFFYSLYIIRRCNKNHFWNGNIFDLKCLRCKKSSHQINMEGRLRGIRNED